MQAATMAAADEDCLLSETQVQDEFGIGVRILRDWRHAGEGEGPPVTKIGPRLKRYRRGSVRDWLRAQEAGSVGGGPEYPDYDRLAVALDNAARVAVGNHNYWGSVLLDASMTVHGAPFFWPVHYGSHGKDDADTGSFVVIPWPGPVALADRAKYLVEIDRIVLRHTGCIVASPGHDWRQVIERRKVLAPYLPDDPDWIVCHRADRFLCGEVPAPVLAAGDQVERELAGAAQLLDIPFHMTEPDTAT